MNHFLRTLFFLLVVRPISLIVLGMNVRHKERLPKSGPAVIAANHNSHLDALVLMTLYNSREMKNVRPVAASDYFYRNNFLKWFALNIIGIVPIDRTGGTDRASLFAPIDEALEQNQIIIIFPEGSRGDPEELDRFKTGISHIARTHEEVDIVPVFMHGLGKALPKGEAILVPFFCDIFIGEAFRWSGDRLKFMNHLTESIQDLANEGQFPAWE